LKESVKVHERIESILRYIDSNRYDKRNRCNGYLSNAINMLIRTVIPNYTR